MKKLLFLLVLCLNFLCSQSQIHVIKTKTSPNNNGDNLHRIANDFSKEVGNKLKEFYPAKVENVSVKLTVINGMLNLTYSAQITKCSKKESQFYFDHRGGLSARNKISDAVSNSTQRAKKQKTDFIYILEKNYSDIKIVSKNIDKVKYLNSYWVICEFFITYCDK